MAVTGGIRVGGRVRAWLRDGGTARLLADVANTATNYACFALAQWWLGTPNVEGNPGSILGPLYVALGTGTSSAGASPSDQYLFQEAYGTRVPVTYTETVGTTTGLIGVLWTTTQAIGTWTEVGLWDQTTQSAAVGAGGASAGSTSLPLAAGAPAVQGGSAPGSYTTAYIADATNPEYVAIAVTAAAGATAWTLQQPLQYAHAAGTPITVFGGNLWAHAVFSPAVQKPSGQQLLIQWSAPFTPTGP
jgi:hypothetical protein